jgi:hypothetical protein
MKKIALFITNFFWPDKPGDKDILSTTEQNDAKLPLFHAEVAIISPSL